MVSEKARLVTGDAAKVCLAMLELNIQTYVPASPAKQELCRCCRLAELANAVEPVEDGPGYIEKINRHSCRSCRTTATSHPGSLPSALPTKKNSSAGLRTT
jgi:hypothetical protein